MEDPYLIRDASRYDTLKWLFDPQGHRGEGRTMLMAKVFVDLAIEHGYVMCVDHHGTYRSTNHLMQYIKSCIERKPPYIRFGFQLRWNQNIIEWSRDRALTGYVSWLQGEYDADDEEQDE